VAQIIATVSHSFAVNVISLITYSSASGYLKFTCLNSTSHFFSVSSSKFQSLILLSVFNTSAILLAETNAHGSITSTKTSIINDITSCVAYDENTIISEKTHNLASLAVFIIIIHHRKYTATCKRFIITSTDGIRKDKALHVNI
jgi:hypothetical protein